MFHVKHGKEKVILDYRKAKNVEIVDFVREKLHAIINAHVMSGDDERTEEHLKFFMWGFCCAIDCDCVFGEDGDVFLRIPCMCGKPLTACNWTYYLLNINEELKTLRKSINRHYHKKGCPSEEEVDFYGRN